MRIELRSIFERLSLLPRSLLASLVILVGGGIGLGEWVARQIEQGVGHRTSATTALLGQLHCPQSAGPSKR